MDERSAANKAAADKVRAKLAAVTKAREEEEAERAAKRQKRQKRKEKEAKQKQRLTFSLDDEEDE